MKAEGQNVTDRQTDDPVADDLNDEASVGIPCSPQGSCSGDLEAVEELEESRDEEQGDGGGDDGLIHGEGIGDGMGDRKQDGGEDGHAGCSEKDTGPPGGGGFGRGFAADGLTHADGCGSRDGKGHHKGEAGAVEGDLVAGERKPSHDADQEGDQAEDGDLDEDLTSGGCSEEGEATEAGGFEVKEHAAEAVVMAAFDAPERNHHEEGKVAAGE